MSTELSLTVVAVLAAVLAAAAAAIAGILVRRRTAARYIAELRDLRQVAFRDPLTGLGNRAAFHRLLAAPGSRRSTVVLLNVVGHRRHLQSAGGRTFDEAFTLIAGRVRHEAEQAGARAFRLRRDEIAVVYAAPPQYQATHRRTTAATDGDASGALAGRLLAAVPEATTGARAGVWMRARAGVATAPGHTEPDGRLVLAHADLALQSAKRTDAAWARHPATPGG